MIDTSKQSTTNNLQFYRISDNAFNESNSELLQAVHKLKVATKNGTRITCSIGFKFTLLPNLDNLTLQQKHLTITACEFNGIAVKPLTNYNFAQDVNDQTILKLLLKQYQDWLQKGKKAIETAVLNNDLDYLIYCANFNSVRYIYPSKKYLNIFTIKSFINYVARHFNTFANTIYRNHLDDVLFVATALNKVKSKNDTYDLLILALLDNPHLKECLHGKNVLRVLLEYILRDNIRSDKNSSLCYQAFYQKIIANSSLLLNAPAKLFNKVERSNRDYKEIIMTLMSCELLTKRSQLTYNFSDIAAIVDLYNSRKVHHQNVNLLKEFHFKLIDQKDLNLLLKLIGDDAYLVDSHAIDDLPANFIKSLNLDFNHRKELIKGATHDLLSLKKKYRNYNSQIKIKQQLKILELLKK